MSITPFEILVGAREFYALHPTQGTLLDERDGHFAVCSLGAIGKAAKLKVLDYEYLRDGNGIEEAVRILADVIRGMDEFKIVQATIDPEDDHDVVIAFNDCYTKDAFSFDHATQSTVFDPKVKPAPEVLKAFDEAIRVAGSL